MASIGGMGGMAPTQGPGGNGDDKKTGKKSTVRLSDGDHTVSQSIQGQGVRVGDKVKALKEKLSLQAEQSVKPRGEVASRRELRNIPAGTVKRMAAEIDTKVKVAEDIQQDLEVLSKNTTALQENFDTLQKVCKEAKPLSENAPRSVKENARKTWAIIKEKLDTFFALVRQLLQKVKDLVSNLGAHPKDKALQEGLRLYRLCQTIESNQDLSDFVNMNTGEIIREVPKDLQKRVKALQVNIRDLVRSTEKFQKNMEKFQKMNSEQED